MTTSHCQRQRIKSTWLRCRHQPGAAGKRRRRSFSELTGGDSEVVAGSTLKTKNPRPGRTRIFMLEVAGGSANVLIMLISKTNKSQSLETVAFAPDEHGAPVDQRRTHGPLLRRAERRIRAVTRSIRTVALSPQAKRKKAGQQSGLSGSMCFQQCQYIRGQGESRL